MEKQKLEQLREYYKNNRLVLVGLNDSQDVNITSSFFKKGLLQYISSVLKSESLDPLVFDAFSLTMNKTEHIDYFLKANLSLEEIKLSQIYSVISALEKVMKDFNLPKSIAKVGNAYRLIYEPKKGDETIFLTDSLKEATEPILIYSSGVNNLMREIGNNPTSIKKDYQNKNQSPNYNYTLQKIKDPNTLNLVMSGIETNFKNIFKINSTTDIYALGICIPKILEEEGLEIFKELIISYNERLIELCKKYNITYINTEQIGKMYNKSEMNFHIDFSGHNALAEYILNCIWETKINGSKVERNFEIENNGPDTVIDQLTFDYTRSILKNAEEKDPYSALRQMQISKEHLREIEIFRKVNETSITTRMAEESVIVDDLEDDEKVLNFTYDETILASEDQLEQLKQYREMLAGIAKEDEVKKYTL